MISGLCLDSACLKFEGLKLKLSPDADYDRSKKPKLSWLGPKERERCRFELPRAHVLWWVHRSFLGMRRGSQSPDSTQTLEELRPQIRGVTAGYCVFGALCLLPVPSRGAWGRDPNHESFIICTWLNQSALTETIPRISPRFHADCDSNGPTSAVPAGVWPVWDFCCSLSSSSPTAPSELAFLSAAGRFLPSLRPKCIPCTQAESQLQSSWHVGQSHGSPWQGQVLGDGSIREPQNLGLDPMRPRAAGDGGGCSPCM